MTKNLIAIMCTFLFMTGTSGLTQEMQKFQLELSPATITVHQNQPIDMDLVLTNTSNSPLTLRSSFKDNSPEFFYDIVVRSTEHPDIKESAYERSVKGHGTIALDFNSKFVTLQPGEQLHERLHLSKLFELNQTGSYTVQVERPIQDLNPKATMVKSNTASLVVIP